MFLYTQLSLGLLVISVNMGWESSLMSWFDIGKLVETSSLLLVVTNEKEYQGKLVEASSLLLVVGSVLVGFTTDVVSVVSLALLAGCTALSSLIGADLSILFDDPTFVLLVDGTVSSLLVEVASLSTLSDAVVSALLIEVDPLLLLVAGTTPVLLTKVCLSSLVAGTTPVLLTKVCLSSKFIDAVLVSLAEIAVVFAETLVWSIKTLKPKIVTPRRTEATPTLSLRKL